MQEVYGLLKKADMLVIASPIYYHGISGQLKCVMDRFYAVAYPVKPPNLKKIAMILSSGDELVVKQSESSALSPATLPVGVPRFHRDA